MGIDPRGSIKGDIKGVWDDDKDYQGIRGVTTDDAGALYVADWYGVRVARSENPDKIEHFTSSVKSFGARDGPAQGPGSASFFAVTGVAASTDGTRVFVGDAGNNALRVIITEMGADAVESREVHTILLRDENGNNVDVFPGYLLLGPPNKLGEQNEVYLTEYAGSWYSFYENSHVVYKIVLVNGVTPNEKGHIIGRLSIIGGELDTDGFSDKLAVDDPPSRFDTPRGMTMDKDGNLYVCDSYNNVIRVIDPNGITWTYAGDMSGIAGYKNGDKLTALFSQPSDIVHNIRSATFYVADTGNNAIREINSKNGRVRLIAGASYAGYVDGIGGCARLTRPRYLALDPEEMLYFTDIFHSTVRKITLVEGRLTEYCKESNRLYGEVTTIAGKPYQEGYANGHENTLDQPSDVAIDKYGNIIFTDDDAQCIRKLHPSGFVSVIAGKCDEYGFTDGFGTNARFEDIFSIAIDDSRKIIYVADKDNQAIRKVAKNGYVSTFAGDPDGNKGDKDGLGTAAMFNEPVAVTLDDHGFLYVADKYNNKVKKITRKGVVTTFLHKRIFVEELREIVYNKFTDRLFLLFDENIISVNMRGDDLQSIIGRPKDSHKHGSSIDAGTGIAAGFNNPYAMDIDAEGFIFVTDTSTNVIRMISPGPMRTVTTIAGSFDLMSGHRDGIGSRAMFHHPWGITLDHFGNLLVADADTSTLRKIRVIRPPVA
eukprot:CAMPEP_0182420310 /NCGR_PEP_ID=MMETSP1167-20130531/5035_1 /TAXON_ID=2988 /ORGANISM="Mallomonas Sp, Strain CCMP3275" /LENGTH=710 /DNA_ID=CAMNT_0024596127 /DNA_START=397 /DNA_END=2529 /DNA_ORIENTATION=-